MISYLNKVFMGAQTRMVRSEAAGGRRGGAGPFQDSALHLRRTHVELESKTMQCTARVKSSETDCLIDPRLVVKQRRCE